MSDPYLAEIRIFPYNFAPQGWALCDGQLLPISQNTALFHLLGTTYGGDGKSTFALPDLRGRAAMHPGQGDGLSHHTLGEKGGAEKVPLLENQVPGHHHELNVSDTTATDPSPVGNLLAKNPVEQYGYPSNGGLDALSPQAITATAGQPHNNMQPYLTFSFCIAIQGVFPARL